MEACGRRGGALLSLFLFSGGWPAVAAVFVFGRRPAVVAVGAGASSRMQVGAAVGFRMRVGALRPAGELRPAEDSSPGRGLFTRLNHAGTMIFENNWLNL